MQHVTIGKNGYKIAFCIISHNCMWIWNYLKVKSLIWLILFFKWEKSIFGSETQHHWSYNDKTLLSAQEWKKVHKLTSQPKATPPLHRAHKLDWNREGSDENRKKKILSGDHEYPLQYSVCHLPPWTFFREATSCREPLLSNSSRVKLYKRKFPLC